MLKLVQILFNVILIVPIMSFFLVSKERDLSNKSRDEEDSKKVKESDSLSSLPNEIFSDRLNSSELAKLLLNCLKSVENRVIQPFTFHEKAKGSQIKMTESLEIMLGKSDDLEKEIKEKFDKFNHLEKNIKNLVEKHKSLSSEQGCLN